jgi:hypothetical protein
MSYNLFYINYIDQEQEKHKKIGKNITNMHIKNYKGDKE